MFWSTHTQVGDTVPPCEHEKPEFTWKLNFITWKINQRTSLNCFFPQGRWLILNLPQLNQSKFPPNKFPCLVISWFANEYSWLRDRITGWHGATLVLSVKLVVRPKRADQNASNRWEKSVNIHHGPNTQLCTFGLQTELQMLPSPLHSPLVHHVWACPRLAQEHNSSASLCTMLNC